MQNIYALKEQQIISKDSSYWNKIVIDTKVIWMMIEISTLFCQPHRSNSFMVLHTISNNLVKTSINKSAMQYQE